jgi:hypothetical protein
VFIRRRKEEDYADEPPERPSEVLEREKGFEPSTLAWREGDETH